MITFYFSTSHQTFLFDSPTVKGLSLTYAQLKLYGFVKDGKIMVPKCDDEYNHDRKNLQKLKKLTNPKSKPQKYLVTDDDIHCTFAPKKDPKAVRAMKNSRCGYDFLNKDDKTDFLQRVGNTSEKTQSKKDKYLEADYDAKLDKLVCPKCKKEQSYDEFSKKIRECRMCNKRFGPSCVINQESFERKLKANENKRLEKLAKTEDEVYGYKPFKARPAPKVPVTSKSDEPPDLKKMLTAVSAQAKPMSAPAPTPVPALAKVQANWSTKPNLSKINKSNSKNTEKPPLVPKSDAKDVSKENQVDGNDDRASFDFNICIDQSKSEAKDVSKEKQVDEKDRASFDFNISIDHMPSQPPSTVNVPNYKLPDQNQNNSDGGDGRGGNSRPGSAKLKGKGKKKAMQSSKDDDLDDGYVYEEKFGELLEQRF